MAEEWLFGRYRLVPAFRRLHAGERSVELDARALAVLECLLRHAERVVPRPTLIAAAWPESSIVFDSAVSKVMRRLRVALGDSHGTILQTIYGEGYRLALPATLLPPRPGTAATLHGSAGTRNGAARESPLRPEPSGAALMPGGGPARAPEPAPAAPAAAAAAADQALQRPRPIPDASGKERTPPERAPAWQLWLPWTIAALATLLSGCLAWLLLNRAGPG
ncbi:winged helix-turn-helix domain-containing protein [Luteimonas sp. MC1750]|uniref:winged helix-turn-helix domain-containing protein n=1 Tax=Luteimonas sp. MC1750 TaxID=2799326 RepID=UPI0018F0A1C1|nr:winged helix-turn-helix domain-containing protein [Luteimonas sp. MC1750]MBJ6984160.1 winged helix-turn-helix transcriptional regulator [Luteimonas sp. MC1750]QQO07048.1 winged helix-turn-helix transcriptional regulator [Luteimonas sp. MC1750]